MSKLKKFKDNRSGDLSFLNNKDKKKKKKKIRIQGHRSNKNPEKYPISYYEEE